MDAKCKILIVGPARCGKTRVGNYLAEFFNDSPDFEKYNPTVGVRIHEFEREVKRNRRSINLQVEMWDCSGDKKYENCWVAILREAQGVVLVYDPTDKAQEKEVEMWYKAYIQPLKLSSTQILLLAHQKDATVFRKYQAPQSLASFGFACTTLESDDGIDSMRQSFDSLLQSVAGVVSEKSKADLEGALNSVS